MSFETYFGSILDFWPSLPIDRKATILFAERAAAQR